MEVWANGEECIPLEDINKAISAEDHAQIALWKDSINRENKGNLSQLDPIICRILDDAFRNSFITSSKKSMVVVSPDLIGNGADARNSWNDYYADIIPAMRTAQSKGQLPRGFTARAALDLHWIPDTPQPLPFLTESVIEAFFAVIYPVKYSIIEVSVFSYMIHTSQASAHRTSTMRGGQCSCMVTLLTQYY